MPKAAALGVTTANWLDGPYNRWGFRHVPDLCRTAPIARGDGPVRALPRAERDLGDFAFSHDGRRLTLAELLAETYTDGFLVIQDGAVVTERYLDGMAETDTHLLMSCSKSLTSILFGVLAGRGLLAPEDLVTHAPARARRHGLGRLPAPAHPRHARRQRLGLRRRRVHDPRRLRLPDARPARDDPARHRDLDPHDRARAVRPRRGAVPLLLARHRRARLGARARGRRCLPRALLARGVVAHRRRERGADHARQLRLPGLRGRHLHDAARPRALRPDVPGGRGRGAASRSCPPIGSPACACATRS